MQEGVLHQAGILKQLSRSIVTKILSFLGFIVAHIYSKQVHQFLIGKFRLLHRLTRTDTAKQLKTIRCDATVYSIGF